MKRYILLLLAILAMATSCVVAEPGKTPTTSTTADSVSGAETDAETAVDYLDTLATDTFDGRTLRIFDANDHPEMHINVALEESNGDIINDALYDRDVLMEETFGIEIEYTLSPGATQAAASCRKLDNSVWSGDNEWEFVYSCLLGSALSTSATSGTLCNLVDIEALSLDQVWWSSQLYDTLNLSDIMYFTTGDISPSVYQGCNVMFANSRLLNDYQIDDDLLGIALDGAWTLDKLFSLTKDVNRDVNQDNKLTYQDDIVGINYHSNIGALLGGTDVRVVLLNEDKDGFDLNFNDTHNVDIVDKLRQQNFKIENTTGEANEAPKRMFMEGRSLFYTHSAEVALSHFRDMDDDYVVLPMPKAYEEQESYISTYSGWISSFVAIPKLADVVFAGTMMEAMAYIGYRDIRPEAYETVYKVKALRDEDLVRAGKVLDLCFDNVYLDFNSVFDFGGSNWYPSGAACGETELISGLESARGATEKAIAKFVRHWGKSND